MRRMFSLTSLLPIWLLLLPACSATNTDHCGNREGNLTCSQQSEATPYCSICVADNNGCVAEAPAASCMATTAAASSTSEPATTTSASAGTTTPGELPTGTTDATTTGTSTTSATTTTEPTTGTGTTDQTDTGTTSPPDTTTGTTTTGDTSTGDTGTTVDTIDTVDTLGTTGTSTGDDSTGGTTMEGPFCGNNIIEGDEVCDGTAKDNKTCQNIVVNKWGGGMLKCGKTCESFDDTGCCIGVGMACNILDPRCCGGLFCNLGTCTVN